MNESDAHWPARLRSQGLLARWGLLSLVVLLLFPLIGGLAWSRYGSMGLTAAALAGSLCWVGASVALVLSHLSNAPGGNPLAGMLGGMAFRMVLPLAAGAALHFKVPALREAGILYSLAGFYLVTLPVETWLSLPVVKPRPASPSRVSVSAPPGSALSSTTRVSVSASPGSALSSATRVEESQSLMAQTAGPRP